MFKQRYLVRVFLKLVTNQRLLFLVSRGERQEFKFFDQMVQLFGNKYIINSDPVAEDGAGETSLCFIADVQFSDIHDIVSLRQDNLLSCCSTVLLMFPPHRLSNYVIDTRNN